MWDIEIQMKDKYGRVIERFAELKADPYVTVKHALAEANTSYLVKGILIDLTWLTADEVEDRIDELSGLNEL
jgi:hypothetical protein